MMYDSKISTSETLIPYCPSGALADSESYLLPT